MKKTKSNAQYFGMTSTQVGILGFMLMVACGILVLSIVVFYAMSSSGMAGPINDPPATPMPKSTATVTPTPSPTPTGTPEGLRISSLDELRYYVLEAKMSTSLGEDSVTQYINQEWDNKVNASRTIISRSSVNSPAPTKLFEKVTINNTSWTVSGDKWLRIDYAKGYREVNSLENLMPYLIDLEYVGDEKINEILCKHYELDTDIMKVTTQDNVTITTHAVGDVWIANKANLPPVIIKLKMETDTLGFLFDLTMPRDVPSTVLSHLIGGVSAVDIEVKAINIPVIINPPDLADQFQQP